MVGGNAGQEFFLALTAFPGRNIDPKQLRGTLFASNGRMDARKRDVQTAMTFELGFDEAERSACFGTAVCFR